MKRWRWIAGLGTLLAAGAAWAGGDEPGHVHGPDGRHIAAPVEGAAPGVQILSHHDLKITDTGQYSLSPEGSLVKGADVHSVVYKKGNPQAVVHREHNSYEPEHGVYGSHMRYQEPGEYVIQENVTLPGGEKLTLEFPIWVPDPEGKSRSEGGFPWVPVLGGTVTMLLVVAAFLLGRRSGRQAAARLTLLAFVVALSGHPAEADEEAGHMHGPDGRHIAVAETFGAPSTALRAYLGLNKEIEAFQTHGRYRFKLSIENEELKSDPDLVTLEPVAAQVVGIETAPAVSRPLGKGLTTTGQVRANPNGSVTVNSRVAGRVVQLNVTPGQEIAAGHVVAVVDSSEVAEAQAALVRAQSELRQVEAHRAQVRAQVRQREAGVAEAGALLERVQAQRAEAKAEVERARAEVETAEARVENARKALARQESLAAAGAFAQGPVETARAAVAAAEGELQQAQSGLGQAESQARRLEQGLKVGVIARRELEAAQTAAEQARTRVATAERQLQIARAGLTREERLQRENLRDAREVQTAQADVEAAQLGVRTAQAGLVRQQRAVEAAEALIQSQRKAVDAARAQVEVARGEMREANAAVQGASRAVRSALDRLQLLGGRPGGGSQVAIRAPIGGEVHVRSVTAGQTVAAGEALCTIVNIHSVWVESNVFERDLPRVREGQRVSLAAVGVPGRTFHGTVSHVEHEVNPETRTVRVRTVVPNPGELLRPNMFVQVHLSADGGSGGSAITVPVEALQELGGEPVVFVVEGDGAYRKRPVRVGTTLGDQVVLEDGVKPGERVVTRGAYQLLAKVRK